MILGLTNPWGIDLSLLKSDVSGEHLGGNKYHKLSGYFAEAGRRHLTHLVTMAGAHSNHVRAFAALARREGFRATAIIRGEELSDELRQNETIRFTRAAGTRCVFISRERYRALRGIETVAQCAALMPEVDFSSALFIPEGGLGIPAVQGIKLWAEQASGFDSVWLPCATGATAAGFLAAEKTIPRVVGVAVLRNTAAVEKAIRLLAPGAGSRFELIHDFADTFGKRDAGLAALAAKWSEHWGVYIDETYMARAVQALEERAQRGVVTGRTLLVYTYNE